MKSRVSSIKKDSSARSASSAFASFISSVQTQVESLLEDESKLAAETLKKDIKKRKARLPKNNAAYRDKKGVQPLIHTGKYVAAIDAWSAGDGVYVVGVPFGKRSSGIELNRMGNSFEFGKNGASPRPHWMPQFRATRFRVVSAIKEFNRASKKEVR